MSDKPTDQPSEVNVFDPELPDEQVVEQLAATLPPAVRLVGGEAVRQLLFLAIQRERQRCQFQLEGGSRYNAALARKAEGEIQAAILANNGQPPPPALVQRRVEAVGAAKALRAAKKVVGNPPGGCANCGGAKVVPSAVRMSGGQTALLPCPACCAPADPPEATASASSSDPPSGSA